MSPWYCQNMEEATAAMQQLPTEAAATSAPSNLRFHTKNSFFLGKWTPRSATIPATKDHIVKTNQPLYLEQVPT
jgi:hypothetical protein